MTNRSHGRRKTGGASTAPPDRNRGARGQVLALFVGGMFLLFLVAGLVIDGGTAFLNRRDGQNSADVAAIAGTKQLADYYLQKAPLDVYGAVATSAAANGCTASCKWTASYVGSRSTKGFRDLGPVTAGDGAPPPGALGVKVDVTRRPHTYFLGVIGQSTWTVDTTATAIGGTTTSAPAGQLLPIAIWKQAEFKTGTIYAFTNGKDVAGTFGWLTWSGSDLAKSICRPNNPSFQLGKWFAGDEGGSNSSSVRNCLQKWVDSKETVLIPIVDKETTKDDNTRYHVVAIAAFTITAFSQQADGQDDRVDQINGRFEGTLPYSQGATAPGGITATPSVDSPFYYIGLAE